MGKIALLFAGQGAQYPGMGKRFLRTKSSGVGSFYETGAAAARHYATVL